MAFKHGYTLTDADDKKVILFNPHGKDEEPKERQIFDKQIKNAFDEIKSLVPKKGKPTEEAKTKIKTILNKHEPLKKEFVRVMGSYKMKVEAVEEEDVAKGFVKKNFEIGNSMLDISYKTLHQYFSELNITVLKKYEE